MNVEIRVARSSDAEAIADLGKATFSQAFGYLFKEYEGELAAYLGATFGADKLRKSLENSNDVYWLAVIDGLAIGYAKLKRRSALGLLPGADSDQLQKIYVLKEFAGRGIGQRLLDVILRGGSVADVIWLAVLRENQQAIRFYERNRFTPLGDHQFAIGSQTFSFCVMTRRCGARFRFAPGAIS